MNQLSINFPKPEEQPIGVLVNLKGEPGSRVCCQLCSRRLDRSRLSEVDQYLSPVYRVNIEPYRQSCCDCGRLLVAGRTNWWPEAFNGK